MPGTTHCFIPVLGKRIRVTELDQCGVPTVGTSKVVVTDGFVTVSLGSEVETGTEIIQKNAQGNLCVNEKMAGNFKRFTVNLDFCGVNPDLLELVTNAKVYADAAGDNAGFTVAEGVMDTYFALELWTGLSGQACQAGAEEASGYLLLPFVVGGILGDVKVDGESPVTFSLTDASTKGGNGWGTGFYEVVYDDSDPAVAAVLPTALDPLDHLLLVDTSVAPPPVACSATTLEALVP